MSDAGVESTKPYSPATPRVGARVLGGLSLALFFVPLVAPLVQFATLVFVLWTAWRGRLDRTSIVIGAGGAAIGFVLFLATEYIWIV